MRCPLIFLQELEPTGWVSGHANLPSRQVGDLGLVWWHPLLIQDRSVLVGWVGVVDGGMA